MASAVRAIQRYTDAVSTLCAAAAAAVDAREDANEAIELLNMYVPDDRLLDVSAFLGSLAEQDAVVAAVCRQLAGETVWTPTPSPAPRTLQLYDVAPRDSPAAIALDLHRQPSTAQHDFSASLRRAIVGVEAGTAEDWATVLGLAPFHPAQALICELYALHVELAEDKLTSTEMMACWDRLLCDYSDRGPCAGIIVKLAAAVFALRIAAVDDPAFTAQVLALSWTMSPAGDALGERALADTGDEFAPLIAAAQREAEPVLRARRRVLETYQLIASTVFLDPHWRWASFLDAAWDLGPYTASLAGLPPYKGRPGLGKHAAAGDTAVLNYAKALFPMGNPRGEFIAGLLWELRRCSTLYV